MVTGGTGSIGEQIVSSLLSYQPKKIVIFSKDDSKQYLMKQKYLTYKNLFFLLGDIRDYDSIEYATRGTDFVFHVAALKQVPICEENPFEAVKTNIIGSENVIRACIFNNVKKVVNVSTDKAVNPTNTMGATKFISEKMFTNANTKLNNKETVFCSVRFGNVINSRGSVIPLFMKQAKDGKPLTVTDPGMTRFIMSISNAANLTLKSIYFSRGGETFIFKMKAIRILTLAEVIQSHYANKGVTNLTVQVVGSRPGEKLFEELIYDHEVNHVVENDELYVILPQKGKDILPFRSCPSPMIRSDKLEFLSKDDILKMIETLEDTW
nr:polysaccharide biosynthesis protein [Alteribacter salitolerans]